MEKKKLSATYRFLQRLGMNYSEEEYGQVTLWQVLKRGFRAYKNCFLFKFGMESWLLSPILIRKVRPAILRKIGCHVGKGVAVGDHIFVDGAHSELIYIEDNVQLTSGCRLLCHQRDLTGYCVGDDNTKLKYRTGEIHLKKGCMLGMQTMVMPGVTIGEGAIVGAFSLVTKDIPAWTIATGRPARVVREIPKRETENTEQ